MESGKPNGQSSSLDSLRTVEFRQTLRGYHIDDVDEYLERVAVDAEALQEQVRQAGERLRQAAERIAQLEGMLQEVQLQPQAAAPVSDDTLQRTLAAGPEVRRPDPGRSRGPGARARGRRRGARPQGARRRRAAGQVGHRGHRAAPARGDHEAGVDPRPARRRRRDHRTPHGERAQPVARRAERHAHVGRRARPADGLDPGAASRAAAHGPSQRRPAHHDRSRGRARTSPPSRHRTPSGAFPDTSRRP